MSSSEHRVALFTGGIMRPWFVMGLVLAALPARSQELPLAMRRTPAQTQRAMELGVTAGFEYTGRVELPDFHGYATPLTLELGLADWFEVRLLATVYDEDPARVADRTFLTAVGGGVGVQLVGTPQLAIAAALDLTAPLGLEWILTPSVDATLVWRDLRLQGGARLALAQAPSRASGDLPIAYCRSGDTFCRAEGGQDLTTLGGTFAASWIAGAFVPGARLDVAADLASPSPAYDPSVRTLVAPLATSPRVHLGPQLDVLLTDHAMLRLGLPLAVTSSTREWFFVASLRVDASLGSPTR